MRLCLTIFFFRIIVFSSNIVQKMNFEVTFDMIILFFFLKQSLENNYSLKNYTLYIFILIFIYFFYKYLNIHNLIIIKLFTII